MDAPIDGVPPTPPPTPISEPGAPKQVFDFKMMDSKRVVGALESLGKLSEELRQFFVVQPRCEQEQIDVLDHVIRTSVELTELEIDFSSVAPGESFDAS